MAKNYTEYKEVDFYEIEKSFNDIKKQLKITDKEIQTINDVLNLTLCKKYSVSDPFYGFRDSATSCIFNNNVIYLNVKYCDDYWFYLFIDPKFGDSKYYKCDQLDGLVKCIKEVCPDILEHIIDVRWPELKSKNEEKIFENMEEYYKISDREYYLLDVNLDKRENISKSEINEISQKIQLAFNRNFSITTIKTRANYIDKISGIFCNSTDIVIKIIRTEDDWFYLDYQIGNNTFLPYKCDQLEGLIKCIEHIGELYN